MATRTTAALRRLSEAGYPDLARHLDSLFAAVAVQAATDEAFAATLSAAVGGQVNRADLGMLNPGERSHTRPPQTAHRADARARVGRRPPGPFDPYEIYAKGEGALREHLATCNVEQLKDIIATNGMDHDRLALRWKNPQRLIERIVETVITRSQKGDVFLAPPG